MGRLTASGTIVQKGGNEKKYNQNKKTTKLEFRQKK